MCQPRRAARVLLDERAPPKLNAPDPVTGLGIRIPVTLFR